MKTSKVGQVAAKANSAAELAALLETEITEGVIAAGDKLDPMRKAAQAHDLAINTVAAAYRLLAERGLVAGRGRQGTIVSARPAIGHRLDEPIRAGLIDLSSGNPDLSLLPDIARFMGKIDTAHVRYGQPAVEPELVRLLAADYRSDGVDATNFTICSGALDGIERVLGAHLRSGDSVAVEDPGYSAVFELLAALGLHAVPMAVDDEGPTVAAVQRAIGAGVQAMIITSRAQNPTGASVSKQRAEDLAAHLSKTPDVLLIEDDHAGLVAGQPFHTIVRAERTRWATVRSVAKSLGPDLRVASIAGDKVTVSRVAGRQSVGAGWVSHLLQRLVVAILSEKSQRVALSRASVTYRHRRDLFRATLSAGGVGSMGDSGFTVWVPVPDEAVVVAGMQQRGFAIRPGAQYRLESAPAVRISVASASDAELTKAAQALIEVLTPGGSWRSA